MSMTWRAGLAGLAIIATAVPAAAQMPYAGMQARSIKSLSDEQIADLRAGRGMSLALAAELNGYPGPSHVLEHAEALKLSDEQHAAITQLFESMKAEAIPIGQQLLAREADLDRQFADRTITADRLATTAAAIGEVQWRLRAAHLKYHLLTRAALTEGQVRRYAELRGYAGDAREHRRKLHAN
jgi:hypothetical protein